MAKTLLFHREDPKFTKSHENRVRNFHPHKRISWFRGDPRWDLTTFGRLGHIVRSKAAVWSRGSSKDPANRRKSAFPVMRNRLASRGFSGRFLFRS